MNQDQAIAFIAGALHGGRSADEGFGDAHTIAADIKIAQQILAAAKDAEEHA